MLPNVSRSGFIPKSSGLPQLQRRGNISLVVDSREFEQRFGVQLTHDLDEALKRGLAKAGTQLMEDTISDLPTTPILTSALRGSATVFVDEKEVAESSQHRNEGAKDFQTHSAEPTARGTNADIVFNAPYAAVQHEMFEQKSEPTAGTKYMEKKLVGNATRYMEIIADEVKF